MGCVWSRVKVKKAQKLWREAATYFPTKGSTELEKVFEI